MKPGGSTAELRRRNRDQVLRVIASEASEAPVSRSHIARRTGLTGAAVSRITRELIDAGLVCEGETLETKGQVGRRNICLELSDRGAYILAIALTANVKSVSISNSRGEIIAQKALEEVDLTDQDRAISGVVEAAKEFLRSSDIDQARLVGCGVSVAGVVEPNTGRLVQSEPLGWREAPLGELISRALEVPVRVERRPIALLMAERWRGAARGLDNVVLISNGLWMGGCMVADGRFVHGASNRVGQLAHMAVPGNETPCRCGRVGCLDVIASGSSIVKALNAVSVPGARTPRDPGERLRTLARYQGADRPDIATAFRSAGRQMGYAVDSMFELLDPQLVLLAGETSRHPAYLEGVQDTLRRLRPVEQTWPVKVSEVTSDQSAVWLGLDAFVYSDALNIEQLMAA